MEPYRSFFPHAGLLLPETERLAGCVLSLPTGTAVGEYEISRICQIIRTVAASCREVRERLEQVHPLFPARERLRLKTARPKNG
jgi:hypothetical protein